MTDFGNLQQIERKRIETPLQSYPRISILVKLVLVGSTPPLQQKEKNGATITMAMMLKQSKIFSANLVIGNTPVTFPSTSHSPMKGLCLNTSVLFPGVSIKLYSKLGAPATAAILSSMLACGKFGLLAGFIIVSELLLPHS